ncbi:hypothetical protein MHH81_08300 [Psychrobacillus sp. FSL H8-0484]|uniref:hypothetical protein n=1 Tax=Psychrobacillus sp. FSL H8-0484 TaxID=2921390 RepID=UPI0030F8DB66
MKKKIVVVLLVLSLLILSACGSIRNSNEPPTPETQIDNQDKNLPNTGNEEVNKENDIGIPDTGNSINDPTLEKSK